MRISGTTRPRYRSRCLRSHALARVWESDLPSQWSVSPWTNALSNSVVSRCLSNDSTSTITAVGLPVMYSMGSSIDLNIEPNQVPRNREVTRRSFIRHSTCPDQRATLRRRAIAWQVADKFFKNVMVVFGMNMERR